MRMGSRRGKAPGREPHTLAGAYAMDAISAADRVVFERHLTGCQECAQEVAGLREATARLAVAAALPPPSGLKERVMTVAAMTRQQPPSAAEAHARSGVPVIVPWFRSLAWPGRLAAAAAAAATVAVLGAAVVFGVANSGMRHQLSQAQASSQQVAAVLTAKDARMMTGQVAGGGTATIVMSHARDALVFTAAGLHALPASRGYELWLIGPAGDRPAGMLPPVSHDMTGPVIASGLRPGDHLALTAGPAAGASRPAAPVMLNIVL